jgi:lysophospholipase L1-like esterase
MMLSSLKFPLLPLAFVCSFLLFLPALAQDRWDKEISAFEQQDRITPPAKNGILFTGSSSIRMWKDLPTADSKLPMLNRGFGGSQIPDITRNFDRLIPLYAPKQIVIYSGDNDINSGKTPQQVAQDFQELYGRIKAELPRAHVAFIAIKPSIARWKLREEMALTNQLIRQFLASEKRTAYVDIWPGMLGPDGTPNPAYYLSDGLHMTTEGYAVWEKALQPHLRRR